MKTKLFNDLMASVREVIKYRRGEKANVRTTTVLTEDELTKLVIKAVKVEDVTSTDWETRLLAEKQLSYNAGIILAVDVLRGRV
jgi:hypothetical protein